MTLPKATAVQPTLADLERIVRAWLPAFLGRTDPRGKRLNRADLRQSLEQEIIHLETCLFEDVYPMAGEWLAQHFVEEHGLTLKREDPLWHELVALALRAKLEASREQLGRLSNITGQVHDAELFGKDKYALDEQRSSGSDISLGDAMDRFISEKATALKGKTITLYSARVKIISEALGRDRPLNKITRDDCRRVRDDVIMKLPARFRQVFPTETIPRAIQIAEKRALPRYSRATQSLFVEVMATFFRWAVDQELIGRDPAKGLRLSRGGDEERKAFDTSQIKLLLAAPVFTGAKDERQYWAKPGKVLVSDHRYWVPLIALFSGMRLNEICQLLTSDVIENNGVLAFDIRPSKRAGKSVKTKAGHRQVPVHPMLMSLGFAAYFASIKNAGQLRLFPDLNDQSETRSGSEKLSKWFARLLDSVGLSDPSLTFHSLRHTFADALREADVPTEAMDRIMGWSAGSERARYGSGMALTKLHTHISRVAYPGLSFAALESLTDQRRARWL